VIEIVLEEAAIEKSGTRVTVRAKLAEAPTPLVEAVTVNSPAVLFAVRLGAVATPGAFVVAVAVFEPPMKVPVAPLAGDVNVTVTPETGLP